MRTFVILISLLPLAAFADEGMWTLDHFPSAAVADKYGVDIDAAWLERARLATARIEGGCTGSFVSPNGLVLTNNHCVWGCVREHSDSERNLSNDGFLAERHEDELRCEREQVSVLIETEDITSKIAAATEGLDDAAANDARKRTQTSLEKACADASDGLRVVARREKDRLHRRRPGRRTGAAKGAHGSVARRAPRVPAPSPVDDRRRRGDARADRGLSPHGRGGFPRPISPSRPTERGSFSVPPSTPT